MSRLSVEGAEPVGFSEIRPAAATYNDDKGDEIGGFPPSLEKQSTITKVTSRITRAITSSSAREIEPPPDGGFLAWTQTAMSFLIIFNTWGYIVSFGVFQTYYVNELGYEPSAVSWIGSVQIFLQFFIGTWAGRATDAGYLRFILIVGFSLQLIGIFMTSISTKYYQFFLAQGVCTGIGDGLVFTPSLALLSTYFTTRRSLAMGISSAGSGFGGMIFPTIVRQLLPKIGFAWTVRVLGFVVLATSSMAVTFTKTRLPPRKTGRVIEWKVFKELPFTLFTAGMFFNFWGLYFAFYYIGSYGRNVVGVSEADSQSLLLLMNGISIIGRLIPNIIADRFFGPLNTIIPFCFVSSLLIYGWTAIDTRSGLFGWAATYGLLVAGVQSLFPAVVSSLNITDLKMAGVRMGMFFTVVSFACLTGPPFGGFLIQNNGGDYLNAQAWAASSLMVGGFLMVAARLAGTGPVLFMRI